MTRDVLERDLASLLPLGPKPRETRGACIPGVVGDAETHSSCPGLEPQPRAAPSHLEHSWVGVPRASGDLDCTLPMLEGPGVAEEMAVEGQLHPGPLEFSFICPQLPPECAL